MPDVLTEFQELQAKKDVARQAAAGAWQALEAKQAVARTALEEKGIDAPETKAATEELRAADETYRGVEAELRALDETLQTLMPLVTTPAGRAGITERVDKAAGGWLSAELKQVTSGGGIGAALSPVQHMDALVDRLAPRPIGLASGFTILPVEAGQAVIPRVTDDPVAAWVEEGQPITKSVPSGDSIAAEPQELAALVAVSTRVVADGRPSALAVAEATMLRSVALKLDAGLFYGSGIDPEPLGIGNTTGIGAVPLGGPIVDLDPFANAIAELEASDAIATAFYMHPTNWGVLRKLREKTDSLKPLLSDGTADAPRAIFNVPVHVSSQLPLDEILVAEAPQVIAVRREDAELVIDPYYDLDRRLVGIRLVMRWDVVLPNPLAVAAITGITPTP